MACQAHCSTGCVKAEHPQAAVLLTCVGHVGHGPPIGTSPRTLELHKHGAAAFEDVRPALGIALCGASVPSSLHGTHVWHGQRTHEGRGGAHEEDTPLLRGHCACERHCMQMEPVC